MSATNILERIALAGVRLTALDDGRLWAEPAEALTDELCDTIREHKPALLDLLRAADEPRPWPGREDPVDLGQLQDLVREVCTRLGHTQLSTYCAERACELDPKGQREVFEAAAKRMGIPVPWQS